MLSALKLAPGSIDRPERYENKFQFVVVHAGGRAVSEGVSVGETVGEQSYFFDDAQRILGVICVT